MGAVQMIPLAPHGELIGIILVLRHRGGEVLEVLLRRHAVHVLIDGPDPLEIAVAVGVGVADDEGPVLPDDEGVGPLIVLFQREVVLDIRNRQAGHQRHTGPLAVCGMGGGHPQQDHLLPRRIVCPRRHGHLLVPPRAGRRGKGLERPPAARRHRSHRRRRPRRRTPDIQSPGPRRCPRSLL